MISSLLRTTGFALVLLVVLLAVNLMLNPARFHPAACRAGVHRDAFANVCIPADDQPRCFAFIMHRLRRTSERGKWLNFRARADLGDALDGNMGDQLRAVSDRDFGTDHAIRADHDIGAEFRAVRDARGGSDLCHVQSTTIMAPTSASQTSSPRTLASPLNHHIVRRFLICFM